jgi:hypothetical protein
MWRSNCGGLPVSQATADIISLNGYPLRCPRPRRTLDGRKLPDARFLELITRTHSGRLMSGSAATGPAGTTSGVCNDLRDSLGPIAEPRGEPWGMAGGWARCRADDGAAKGIPISH